MRATELVSLSPISLALVAACSSPPKPPEVDESTRRPANSATAVELQTCSNDLHNMRLHAAEAQFLARDAALRLAVASARAEALAGLQSAGQQPSSGNRVYTVRFAFGSSRPALPDEAVKVLVEDAKSASLVVLRGRTDGASDAMSESRIARDRANAVRDLLVAAGIDPSRIRVSHQPSGDHVVDNGSESGRALNRRVEVEIYRLAPVAMPLVAQG